MFLEEQKQGLTAGGTYSVDCVMFNLSAVDPDDRHGDELFVIPVGDLGHEDSESTSGITTTTHAAPN